MNDKQKDHDKKKGIAQRLTERGARSKQERVEQIKRTTARYKEHVSREARSMKHNISEKTQALMRQKQMQAPNPAPAKEKGRER
ncbi:MULTISPECIES: hypothetical protein [Aquimarina]|uniref:Uncharacterized protein n=1 Tax=Aquimarina algiphila TaxID=2047982 RepID=A0A554VCG6_9FLAO|nr:MULTISPECIES: hypothetical protein [Aquimarina]TSE04393.1 hypothetical protein FOF46_26570 [Aquimarina algiphila]